MPHRHIHRTYVPDGIYPHTKSFGVGVYFVTTDVRYRIAFFRDDVIARFMKRSIWHERTSRFVLYAYVIMPDHFHLLFQPTRGNVSDVMKSIKENSSRDVNTYLRVLHSGDGAVAAMENGSAVLPMGTDETVTVPQAWTRFEWQKGFYDHVIRDERDFRNHIEYIRYNPVRAGLCEEPEEYPFLFVDWDAIQHLFGG